MPRFFTVLAEIFTASSFLSFMHCVKFPALETHPSLSNEFIKYPRDLT